MRTCSALLTAMLTAAPPAAMACGGFFCSQTPVDQAAERIIFVQEDAETVTSYVEIMYEGDDDEFAWVVPVPAVPDFDVWHSAAFDALDLATQPTFQPPWGCYPSPEAAADGGGALGGNSRDADEDGDGVQVHLREVVGPFDIAVIESDDPRALIEWLRTNGYRIVPEMEPFIALYTVERMKLTALKLAPGEEVSSIRPIKLTYKAANPLVPLRLTSIAAVPEMGVKIWLLGDNRFGPLNVPDLKVDFDNLVFRPYTWPIQTNYSTLVAKAADVEEGKGFVTEYAGDASALSQQIRDRGLPFQPDEDAQAAFDGLLELLDSKPYLTRLYTRLSPAEMDRDPIFAARNDGAGDVSNQHDFSERDDLCGQGDIEAPQPCAFVACGAGGECFMAADGDGAMRPACVCADGAVARAVPSDDPQIGVAVACVDRRLNFLGQVDDSGAGSDAAGSTGLVFADPCIANACGANGRCISLNGTPTCACDRGFVAIARPAAGGGVSTECVTPERPVPNDFYLRSLREPDLPFPGRKTRAGSGGVGGDSGGCAATDAPTGIALIALVLGAAPLLRRRRRR